MTSAFGDGKRDCFFMLIDLRAKYDVESRKATWLSAERASLTVRDKIPSKAIITVIFLALTGIILFSGMLFAS